MDGDEICPRQQLWQLQDFHPKALAALFRHEGIIGQREHPQSLGFFGDQGPDPPQTDDA
jgi:hypothetical protein